MNIECYPTGWQAALLRPPKLKAFTAQLAMPAPGVVSLPVRAAKIKTTSFTFAQPKGETKLPSPLAGGPPAAGQRAMGGRGRPGQAHAHQASARRDPARRPAVLPVATPLETLLGCDSLAFPFRPFPYQFEGVAFLYPRVAAVLADEMGLGKTMQAITAVRMLLHAREIATRVARLPQAAGDQLAAGVRTRGRPRCR